jgi:ubiquinone/menaquinone biosynthesis C-methylase UbiE
MTSTLQRSLLLLALLVVARPAAAQLASKPAEQWLLALEAKDRVSRLRAPEIVGALKLKPGQTVADIGCGSGIFTIPLALAVRPGGTVYAVDLDKVLVDASTERGTEQGLSNIQGAVGTADDPNMPVNVNLAFLHDTLRYIDHKAAYVKMLGDYLEPGGRIAVIEFKPDQYPDRLNPELVITQEDTTALMAAIGLKPVETITTFPDRWFVIYGK